MLMRLSEVVGHETAKVALRRAYASDRLHHAYLFAGPSGVGKRTLAMALAALVNCERPIGGDSAFDACGTCRSCIKLAGGGHPDVLEVAPEGRDIKIAQVRELHAATKYRPYEAARRLILIDDAHTLRVEAANALLKTLEEPRGDTMFVLVTPQSHRLLTTVISRCQPMRFGPLEPSEVDQVLRRVEPDLPPDPARGRLAEGSVGRALAIAHSPVYGARLELLNRFVALRDDGLGAATAWADELSRQRDAIDESLELVRSFVRDAILHQAGAATSRLVHADAPDAIARLVSGRSSETLLGLADAVDETAEWLAGNVNARLALEDLFLRAAARTP